MVLPAPIGLAGLCLVRSGNHSDGQTRHIHFENGFLLCPEDFRAYNAADLIVPVADFGIQISMLYKSDEVIQREGDAALQHLEALYSYAIGLTRTAPIRRIWYRKPTFAR
jgi:hypothetical protein